MKGMFGKELFELAKKHNIDSSTVHNIKDLLKDDFKDLLEEYESWI